jgi:hypothetical protein
MLFRHYARMLTFDFYFSESLDRFGMFLLSVAYDTIHTITGFCLKGGLLSTFRWLLYSEPNELLNSFDLKC